MDGPLEEPEQQQRDLEEVEEEDDNESIDFVRIDQSEEKEDREDDDDDQENSDDQEEGHDQVHHLVEGTVEGADGGGGEQQQERNLTDWSFDGTMDSSAGGQSATELVNLRMAALTAKNQVLVEQLKNAQLQAQIAENVANVVMLEAKNKALESQLKNGELREKELEKGRELNIVQLQAQIADYGAKFAVLMEKSKRLEKQLQNVEWHKTALEKKVEEKDKEVAQFTLSLATLGKQLATLSGNSTKIQLHLPRGNHWNSDASSPMFTMNSAVETAIAPPPAGMWGERSGAAEVKWHHAFALEGFPVLDAVMNKGQCNNVNVNSNKTTVFYYEVRIVEPEQHSSEHLYYHAVGLSMGYDKDYDDHVGQHPNSYGFDECGQAYYVCGKILHTRDNLPAKSISASVNGFGDIYGFGLLVKPNKELAIFGTINGMLVGQQVPIQFWSEFLYPTVSVSKLTTKVEANFGTVPFRYDIANCPGLQL